MDEETECFGRSMLLNVELRPLLKIANVTLCYAKDFLNATNTVTVEADSFAFTFNTGENRIRKIVKIPGVSFVPASCSGFHCNDKGLSFRLQLQQVPSPDNRTQSFKNPKPNVGYRCFCAFCKSNLFHETVAFRRVLPMPPEWALGMVSDWFCHGHEDVGDMTERLRPSVKECLIGDDHLMINPDDLDFSRLRVIQDEVECQRCFQNLGDIDRSAGDTTFVRLHKLFVQFCEDAVERPAPWDDLVEEVRKNLWPIVFSRYNNACRILISSATKSEVLQDEPVLLVWLMDDGVTHLVGELKDDVDDLELKLRSSKKILYVLENKMSTTAQQWKTGQVESLELHSELFSILVDALLTSTKTMPRLMQNVGAFWAAYV